MAGHSETREPTKVPNPGKALGLAMPQSLLLRAELLRADQVIE